MTSHHDQITKFTKTLEEWDYKVDRLEHRVKDLPDELREIAQTKYQKLISYRNDLQQKEAKLAESSEKGLLDVEHSIDEVWGTFKLLFEEVEMEVEVEGT